VDGAIVWDQKLDPGERAVISVYYSTWGMEGYQYKVSLPREVLDFELVIFSDAPFGVVTYEPQDGSIQLEAKSDLTTRSQIFLIDHALMAPSVGVGGKQSWLYAPYHEMIVALPYAARASLLFFSIAALTFLICGVPVNLRQLVLLGGLFILPFLMLMSGYVPYPDAVAPAQFASYQMKMLPILSGIPLIISLFLLRKIPRLPLVLVLLLMALAMAGYAFIGLSPDEQKRNAVETLIQACLIGYIFFLTLYIRLRSFIAIKRPVSIEYRPPKYPAESARRTVRMPGNIVYLLILLIGFALLVLLAGKFLNFGGPEFPDLPVIRADSQPVSLQNNSEGPILSSVRPVVLSTRPGYLDFSTCSPGFAARTGH
jgi:hypothetical protein